MKSRVAELIEVLEYVKEMIQQLPSGIDENADPNELSPQDATAHVGGLIWQRIQIVLKKISKVK